MPNARRGSAIPYGHRQDADYSHPAFRFHADRIVRQVVGRYVDHPAIIGYQVDNEPGMELFHNHGAFETFVDRLRERYGDVETLNDRWGLVVLVAPPRALGRPVGAGRQHRAVLRPRVAALPVRADDRVHRRAGAIVRELARPDQFVTTCMSLSRPAFDPADLNRELDIAAVNPYYPMQAALTMPEPPPRPTGPPRWTRQAGAWTIYLQADLTRAARDEPFLVTETNATSIGEPHSNFPAYDGQWRQAAWALVARGARMVEYWHWHSIHFGHEAYWLGVLNHDGEPGPLLRRGQADRRRLQRAPAPASPTSCPTPTSASSTRARASGRWSSIPRSPVEGSLEPDRGSYDRIFGRFYEGLFGAGLQADVVYPQQLGSDADALVARWPVLVVPALYVADDMLLDLLDAYARAGGHLVLGFRSGYADDEARPRPEVMPGRLREAVGASYGEYTNLACRCRCGRTAGFDLPGGAAATAWADALVPEGAETLVGYDDPHLGRWAAVTTQAHGRGRVTYVGTLPGPRARRRARPLAAAGARRLGGPARDRHGHERAQRRGGTAALRVELVMGADELCAAGGGAGPAVRDRPRERRGSGAGGVGCPGASGECPGGEQRGGESP